MIRNAWILVFAVVMPHLFAFGQTARTYTLDADFDQGVPDYFVFIRLDANSPQAISKQYQAESQPALAFVLPSGKVYHSLQQYVSPKAIDNICEKIYRNIKVKK